MHDLVIKNGLVMDGEGTPGRHADIGIRDGKLVEIGEVTESGNETIDASDLVVAPGFIDPHTHYDAQVCWDPLLSCSSWHGITTAIMGHCGVGIAPARAEMHKQLAMDLVTIESIPYEILEAGVTWDWTSFSDYMNASEKRGLGINAGFMAPLTPFRRWVMGYDATERAATPDETTQIAALLKGAIEGGAMGFSTTLMKHHFGHEGKPLACRLSSREELAAYCHVLRDAGQGTVTLALSETGTLNEDQRSMLDLLVNESNRPVTWVFLLARDDLPMSALETLDSTADLIERKCFPQVMPNPLTIQFDLHQPAISLSNMPCWKPLFEKPVEEQLKIYKDPEFRQAFRRDLPKWGLKWPWGRTTIQTVSSKKLEPLIGRSVKEIAEERGQDVIDTFLDLAIEDNLKLRYIIQLFNVNEEVVGKLISDPRTLIGLSDAGAHIDVFCTADYTTHLLGRWVREKQIMSLERAVQRISAEPADFYGIRDRGRLKVGLAADITIFDPRTVDAAQSSERAYDLPGGDIGRLISKPVGMHYTIVNGRTVLKDGVNATGDLPGRVVRPG